jgi:hypothetical protein
MRTDEEIWEDIRDPNWSVRTNHYIMMEVLLDIRVLLKRLVKEGVAYNGEE